MSDDVKGTEKPVEARKPAGVAQEAVEPLTAPTEASVAVRYTSGPGVVHLDGSDYMPGDDFRATHEQVVRLARLHALGNHRFDIVNGSSEG